MSYLRFDDVQASESGKTRIFNVCNKNSGAVLGEVRWYGQWRRYCFFPSEYAAFVFSAGCLRDIATFADQQTAKQKTRAR